jgi:hypothetical protein
VLAANTVYGFDVGMLDSTTGWQQGIPYFDRTNNDGDGYVDGRHYSSGDDGIGGDTITISMGGGGRDMLFHLDMESSLTPPTLPDVDAGSDWLTWSGEPVTVTDVNVVDHSDPVTALTYSWTADPAEGVVFDSNSIALPTVTITNAATSNPTTYTLTLFVNNVDSGNPYVWDDMIIEVYDDSCAAAAAVGSAVSYDPSDVNTDCITNLQDFAEVAAAWLVDYAIEVPTAK